MKMTINSSFIKFHGKKDWEPQHDCYISWFIQASLCKIQGLFKDFLKTYLLFSRTIKLRKMLIYTMKFYFRNARPR